MTDQCSSIRSRERSSTDYETSCRPTDEQKAEKEVSGHQQAEREAEARRNDHFAAGTDEGGRCAKASSDASAYSPMLSDDPKMKEYLRTKRLDPPIQSDPAGNAIIGALAGGVVSGVRAAAAEALLPSTAGTSVLEHAATSAGTSLAKTAGKEALKKTFETGPDLAPAKTSPASPTGPATTAPVGRSGGNGTRSEVVPEATMSQAPSAGPWVIKG
jgi:hypothetical protein